MKTVRFMLISAIAFACSVSILSSQAFAFDGKRKGFVLGFGAGAGNLDGGTKGSGQSMYWTESDLDLPRPGLQTDLKIGLGISNRVLVYYTGKQSWPTEGNILGAFPMLGVSYYTSPAERSLFIAGGLGAGLVAVMDFESNQQSVGLAGYLGAGYAFSRHYYFEFDVTGRAKADDVSAVNLALTLNGLAF